MQKQELSQRLQETPTTALRTVLFLPNAIVKTMERTGTLEW